MCVREIKKEVTITCFINAVTLKVTDRYTAAIEPLLFSQIEDIIE